MLKIVQVPHHILNMPTKRVKQIDEKVRKLVYEMEETLISQNDPQGVGLAAPQVGSNLALFIMKPSPKAKTEVCINPKILKVENSRKSSVVSHKQKDDILNNQQPTTNNQQLSSNDQENTKLEGCLSIPRIWGLIGRSSRVLLEYQDLNGKKHIQWFTGFKAIIVQHEVDHLAGVLFTKRALEQKTPLYEEKDGDLEKMEY